MASLAQGIAPCLEESTQGGQESIRQQRQEPLFLLLPSLHTRLLHLGLQKEERLLAHFQIRFLIK